MFLRNNRQLLRLYLLLILVTGMVGGWYARTNWQIEADTLQALNVTQDEGDWVEFFATIGEETIQLFLGFTSGQ
jgi:hypothetical protein